MKDLLAVSGVALALFCASPAHGSGIIFQYDNTFSGTDPVGSPPWAEAELDNVSPGTVLLTISGANLTASEKLTELYLNISPGYSAGDLVFTSVGGSAGVTAPSPALGLDAFKADGDGKYDIRFQFGQTPSTAFSAGDYLQYKITGIPNLTAQDFEYLSLPAGGHGPYYSAIHVQGIDAIGVTDGNSMSGWVSPTDVTVTPVPEPSSAALLLAAGGAMIGAVRIRRQTGTRS